MITAFPSLEGMLLNPLPPSALALARISAVDGNDLPSASVDFVVPTTLPLLFVMFLPPSLCWDCTLTSLVPVTLPLLFLTSTVWVVFFLFLEESPSDPTSDFVTTFSFSVDANEPLLLITLPLLFLTTFSLSGLSNFLPSSDEAFTPPNEESDASTLVTLSGFPSL